MTAPLKRSLRASVALAEGAKILHAHAGAVGQSPANARTLTRTIVQLVIGRMLEAEPGLSATELFDVFLDSQGGAA